MRTNHARHRAFQFTIVAGLLALSGCGTGAGSDSFEFGIVGDTPYTKVQEQEFTYVQASMDRADLRFVAHVGDFQFDARPYNQNPSVASMPCVDENYRKTLASFETSRHPFILTPGDNDWSDCWPLAAQKADPIELLAKIRTMFYPDGRSLGRRTMPVTSQGAMPQFTKFRENLRWSVGGVTFVTIHTVGSDDNWGRTPEMDAEHLERKAANIAWLRQSFSEARAANSRGVAIITQANPGFENYWPPALQRRYFVNFDVKPPYPVRKRTGYDDLIHALQDEMENYSKPVIYFHGDTHLFRVDKPLISTKTQRPFENFTRAETFGWPESHWLRVSVDSGYAGLFRVEPEIVPENVVSRR
jgi:hypothetical protein